MVELTREEFVGAYPHFRPVSEAMFQHELSLARLEAPEALFGAKTRAALIELVADYLSMAPGADDTRPRLTGGAPTSPYRLKFERIRASLGPFVQLV